jgi:transposase-like protein
MAATPSFHPTCPRCSTGHGIANTVGFSGDQRSITYRCPQCQHGWTETDQVPRLVGLDPPIPATVAAFLK